MAAEEQKDVQDEGISPEVPSDGEVFTDETPGQDLKSDMEQPDLGIHQSTGRLTAELSEYDLFAGDEDFYNLLAESSQEKPVERPAGDRQRLLD